MQTLYSIMLIPGTFWLYVVISIALYHFHTRHVGIRLLYITLVSLAMNTYLKSLFQVPLLPHLGEGWSFPSGHTQAGFVFWGWLALEFRKKISPVWCIIPIFILSLGIYLNHFHEMSDILAAYASGSAVILIFYALQHLSKNNNIYLGLASFTVSLLALLLYPKTSNHFAIVLAGLSTCTLASIHIKQTSPQQFAYKKLVILITALIAFAICYAFIQKPISFDQYFIYCTLMGLTFFMLLPLLFDSKSNTRNTGFLT